MSLPINTLKSFNFINNSRFQGSFRNCFERSFLQVFFKDITKGFYFFLKLVSLISITVLGSFLAASAETNFLSSPESQKIQHTQNAFYARVSNFKFSFSNSPKSFSLIIAGLGRVKIELSNFKKNSSRVFYNNQLNTDPQTTAYFIKGKIKAKHFSTYLSGFLGYFMIQEKLGSSSNLLPVLFLNFQDPKNFKLYQLRLNLNSNSYANWEADQKTSPKSPRVSLRVFRQSRSSLAEDFCQSDQHHHQAHLANLQNTLDLKSLKLTQQGGTFLSNNLDRNSLNRNFSQFQEIEINIDADQSWYESFGANSHNLISMLFNQVESIYQNQLGISFKIVRQNVFTEQNFGDGNVRTHLNNYLNFITSNLIVNITDLSFLLSSLTSPNNEIGFAPVGALCFAPNIAAGTSNYTSDLSFFSVIAHEIGHILGAVHDDANDSGPISCPTVDGFIMDPNLDVFNPASVFSDCSISSIQDYLSVANFCLDTVSEDSSDASPNPLPENPTTPYSGSISLQSRLFTSGLIGFRHRWEINNQSSLKNSDCSIVLDMDYIPSRLGTSEVFRKFQFESTKLSEIITVNVPGRVETTRGLYFQSHLNCLGEQIASSEVNSIFPYQIISTRVGTPRQWLDYFEGRVRQLQ